MPPKTTRKAPVPTAVQITAGAGITAGLELWRVGHTFVFRDTTADHRFAPDVTTWNTAANLNAASLKSFKDATDTASCR
jgi:hypothetical protein